MTTLPPTAGLSFRYRPLPLVLTSIVPNTAPMVAGTSASADLNGTGFVNSCFAMWNGALQATTYVSPTKLTMYGINCNIAGTFSVHVTDTQDYSNNSNALNFQVIGPVVPPMLTSVSPSSAQQGSTIGTLTVTGTNFVSGKRIKIDGVAVATTYVNATTLTTSSVFAKWSLPHMVINVEDCADDDLKVTLTTVPGQITIDTTVYPGSWPHSHQTSPYYGNCYVWDAAGRFNSTSRVYMDGIEHYTYPFGSGESGGQLWFVPTYMGNDPALAQRPKVTVVTDGLATANHGILIVGGS